MFRISFAVSAFSERWYVSHVSRLTVPRAADPFLSFELRKRGKLVSVDRLLPTSQVVRYYGSSTHTIHHRSFSEAPAFNGSAVLHPKNIPLQLLYSCSAMADGELCDTNGRQLYKDHKRLLTAIHLGKVKRLYLPIPQCIPWDIGKCANGRKARASS